MATSTEQRVLVDATCAGSPQAVQAKVDQYGPEIASKTRSVMEAFGFTVVAVETSMASELRDMYVQEGTGE